jgi:NADH dehydrogenase
MEVLVAGGSGFIGKLVCRVLTDRGHGVTALSRSPETADLPDGVGTAAADVSQAPPTEAVAGHDVVVNLVALPSHRNPPKNSHESVHLDGTKHLLQASADTGVERFVHMSALGVDSGVETAYFAAKRRAERAVRDSECDWVIYRPSVVFGDGCAFIPFIRRITPPGVAVVPGGDELRIQPIWGDDLAPMIADGVEADRHIGSCYELGGPERLTLSETVGLIVGKPVISVPRRLAAAGFTIAESLPGVPIGTDQYRALELDNTTPKNGVSAFGRTEDDLRTLGDYLTHA